MPFYDYRCSQCQQRSSIFLTYAQYGKAQPACPHCGRQALRRVITRVRVAKSEDARLDALADPSSFAGLDENDPKSVAKFMRKMGGEMGEDLGPEFDEVVDRLEAGESPESIEQSMPEMGGAGESDSAGGDE